jgi:hypothetical protein
MTTPSRLRAILLGPFSSYKVSWTRLVSRFLSFFVMRYYPARFELLLQSVTT